MDFDDDDFDFDGVLAHLCCNDPDTIKVSNMYNDAYVPSLAR